MNEIKMYEYLLDSIPYPIVFVDRENIIRYLNRKAKYHYYQERGYKDLIGKNITECHNDEKSIEMIKNAVNKLKNNGQEIYLKVNVRNERVYIVPVRDENGEFIGYYERFEMNVAK